MTDVCAELSIPPVRVVGEFVFHRVDHAITDNRTAPPRRHLRGQAQLFKQSLPIRIQSRLIFP